MNELKSLVLWSAVGTAIGAAAGAGFVYLSQHARARKDSTEEKKEEVQKKKAATGSGKDDAEEFDEQCPGPAAAGSGKDRAKQSGKDDAKKLDEQCPRSESTVTDSPDDKTDSPEKWLKKEIDEQSRSSYLYLVESAKDVCTTSIGRVPGADTCRLDPEAEPLIQTTAGAEGIAAVAQQVPGADTCRSDPVAEPLFQATARAEGIAAIAQRVPSSDTCTTSLEMEPLFQATSGAEVIATVPQL